MSRQAEEPRGAGSRTAQPHHEGKATSDHHGHAAVSDHSQSPGTTIPPTHTDASPCEAQHEPPSVHSLATGST